MLRVYLNKKPNSTSTNTNADIYIRIQDHLIESHEVGGPHTLGPVETSYNCPVVGVTTVYE